MNLGDITYKLRGDYTMLNIFEMEHLKVNNFVIIRELAFGHCVVITDELWDALLSNEENQKLINSMKTTTIKE